MIQSKCRIGLQSLRLNTACGPGSCRDTQIENLQIRLTAACDQAACSPCFKNLDREDHQQLNTAGVDIKGWRLAILGTNLGPSQTSSVSRGLKFGCDNQLLITTIIPLLFSMPITDGRRPLITNDESNGILFNCPQTALRMFRFAFLESWRNVVKAVLCISKTCLNPSL